MPLPEHRHLYNYGSINIDHVYRVPHLVTPGETLSSSSYQQVLGGKGANQSLAMARAGGRVSHWGRVGEADRWTLDILAAAGVDIGAITVSEQPSGHALIQVDDDGENAIIVHPGANHGFSDDAIDTLIGSARPGDTLLLQNECNGLARVMLAAREAGLEIAFNPAPMSADVIRLPLESCGLLFVNRGEAAALAGLPEHSPPQALIESLAKRWPDTRLVLTLGGDGVCYRDHEQRVRLPAYRVEAVDTTAAGDTFIGYFMAAWQAKSDIETCLRHATAASALCVQRPGAAPSIPLFGEVEAMCREWPTAALQPY